MHYLKCVKFEKNKQKQTNKQKKNKKKTKKKRNACTLDEP